MLPGEENGRQKGERGGGDCLVFEKGMQKERSRQAGEEVQGWR